MSTDYVQDLKDALKERVTKQPFWLAFVLSWFSLNYEFLVVIGSDWSPTRKFGYVSSSIYSNSWERFLFWAIIPAFLAILITMIYPFLDNFLKMHLKKKEVEAEKGFEEIEGVTGVPRRKHIDLKGQHVKLLAQVEADTKQHTNEIDAWINANRKLVEKAQSLQAKVDSLDEQLTTRYGSRFDFIADPINTGLIDDWLLYCTNRSYVTRGFVAEVLTVKLYKPRLADLRLPETLPDGMHIWKEGVSGYGLLILATCPELNVTTLTNAAFGSSMVHPPFKPAEIVFELQRLLLLEHKVGTEYVITQWGSSVLEAARADLLEFHRLRLTLSQS